MAAQFLRQRGGMGDHDDLRFFGAGGDQPRERPQQIGVQAGFRLVQRHQLRRARRQQRRHQQQIAQGSIGQFGGLQRPQQAMLAHRQAEIAVIGLDRDPRAGKGVFDPSEQGFAIADFDDRLDRGRTASGRP